MASKKSTPRQVLLYVVDKEPLEVLESTPSSIVRAIRGLKNARLQKPPRKGKWSISGIISHLTDAEIVFGYRLRKILAEPGSRIDSYDQNKWAKQFHYDKTDYKTKLALYTVVRKSNIGLLKSLTSKEWKRYGIHQERGKENIEKMILMYAGHDMNHIKQIENIRNIFVR